MNNLPEDDQFVEILAAYDEALGRTGNADQALDESGLSLAEPSPRVQRACQCVARLALVWPRKKPIEIRGTELDDAEQATTSGPKSSLQSPPRIRELGRYRLLEVLGEGGMGTVYKALHTKLNRLVALKVISAHLTSRPQALARFYREMEALGKLEHIHVARAQDADEIDGTHFLVMEYIEGTDLATFARRLGPLRIADACEAVRQAALGLEYAHHRGLVHRDVKPANSMLGLDGTIKLLDLGLALLRKEVAGSEPAPERGLTEDGQLMGTADYMSPEQVVNAHDVDGRADIYSLGCTLYCLLVGQHLFGGEAFDTRGKKLVAHATVPAPNILLRRSDVPQELAAFIAQMLAKNPGHRPPTAAAVASVMVRFAQGANLQRLVRSGGRPGDAVAIVQEETATFQPQGATAPKWQLFGQPGTMAKKARTRALAIGGGLLGIGLVILLALIIRIRHPDGTKTVLKVPDGSEVSVTAKAESGKRQPEGDGPGLGSPIPPLAKPSMFAIEAAQVQKQWAEHLGVPVKQTNSLGMPLVLIPPGDFDMGSTPEEIDWALEECRRVSPAAKIEMRSIPTEAPRHRVKIAKPFYLAIYPVAQGEYEKVMGTNPSAFTAKQLDVSAFKPPLDPQQIQGRKNAEVVMKAGKDTSHHPVEMVNWVQAVEFCHRLTAMPAERAAKRVYRLPTEAEWEYACRAGTTTQWYCGDDKMGLQNVAWFSVNAGGMTHPVGEKRPNAWGLYDLLGNVQQWCADWFSPDYYQQSPPGDPTGPTTGSTRVARGGHWNGQASTSRSASRHHGPPTNYALHTGFRVVADASLP